MKPDNGAAEPLAGTVADVRMQHPDPPVRSLEEFVEFLEQLEVVLGPDDRPRPPMTGHRFLL